MNKSDLNLSNLSEEENQNEKSIEYTYIEVDGVIIDRIEIPKNQENKKGKKT